MHRQPPYRICALALAPSSTAAFLSRPLLLLLLLHLRSELQKSLSKNEDACRKLKTAVANIPKNRVRFAHVDDRELERRRVIVDELDAVRGGSGGVLRAHSALACLLMRHRAFSRSS